MKLLSPRMWFAAALALYLGWVVVLAVMASTSSTRPATRAVAPTASAP
ncbi:MAG: hypothetical protein ACLQGP_41985 [Isosphaeraceae bacterium]